MERMQGEKLGGSTMSSVKSGLGEGIGGLHSKFTREGHHGHSLLVRESGYCSLYQRQGSCWVLYTGTEDRAWGMYP